MSEFLTELLCEEIPARMQLQAAADLKDHFEKQLKEHALDFKAIHTYVTPRRLVAVIEGLAEATRSSTEERRGPKAGAPDAAMQGFLKSSGVSLEQCEQRDGYWWATRHILAQPARAILPTIIEAIIANFNWPKTMRWAGSDLAWVRPMRGILALLDGEVLPFTIKDVGLISGNTTVGHRFLAPQSFAVTSFADYREKLKKAFVILDHQERQRLIVDHLEQLGAKLQLTMQPDTRLLEEVAGLVEFPQPLLGTIEQQFMALPAPVLRTSMRVHQKYFTFNDVAGKIAPYFGFVANTIPSDDGQLMRQGYERVLRARLSDAQFFYHNDKEIPLEQQLEKLNNIIFHAKLGTLAARVSRLQVLVDSPLAKRAAMLCKADLVSSMVAEFPELQGIMGADYAHVQGESGDVAIAIEQHYQPQGPEGFCPTNPIAVELALAEKIDTLTGFFAINERPSGSKDPYALRRAALGIIRLIRENNLVHFNLLAKCELALAVYRQQGVAILAANPLQDVMQFIHERLAHALKSEGMRPDCIAAVMATVSTNTSLVAIVERIRALNSYLVSDSGQALRAAFRRASGILQQVKEQHVVQSTAFVAEAETLFYTKLKAVGEQAPILLESLNFVGVMDLLAELRPTVDAFFELKINEDDLKIRQNRQALLQALITQTAAIADFRLLEG